ncbi:hypothetical protein GOODEAATRI_006252 [Goodea atripinnis]|uniref:Uncharacterized protein n=1 Tax=Goodea atripinnis TaxID=208336 RepID=A0ABV0NBK7_9TELE
MELSLFAIKQESPTADEEGCTILQMEKSCRTRVEVMKGHKNQRMEELKGLAAKDCELCDIMCTTPFSIDQNSLQAEVQRLEVLKMHSMKSVIEAIRVEIAVLWKKCFYSDEQQQAFNAYHDGKWIWFGYEALMLI